MNDDQYIYRIDHNDIIIYVSDNWNDFLIENFGQHDFKWPEIIGRSLWDVISDENTAHLYRLMINNVRETEKSISFPFRCDSKDERRYLTMNISLNSTDHIEFKSTILRIETRSAVHLVDPEINRSEELLKICSYCKNINIQEDTWTDIESAILDLHLFEKELLPHLSHGVCPECYKNLLRAIENS
jgi:hypothetical protein